jgi:hypothetical protein
LASDRRHFEHPETYKVLVAYAKGESASPDDIDKLREQAKNSPDT